MERGRGGGFLVLIWDHILGDDRGYVLGPTQADAGAEEGDRRQRRQGEERHDYGENGIVVNGDGIYESQREEGQEEIGRWFPLLDLLWDDGQHGLNTQYYVG